MSEHERHQWITQILRALADLRESERASQRAVGLDARLTQHDATEQRASRVDTSL